MMELNLLEQRWKFCQFYLSMIALKSVIIDEVLRTNDSKSMQILQTR